MGKGKAELPRLSGSEILALKCVFEAFHCLQHQSVFASTPAFTSAAECFVYAMIDLAHAPARLPSDRAAASMSPMFAPRPARGWVVCAGVANQGGAWLGIGYRMAMYKRETNELFAAGKFDRHGARITSLARR